MEINKAFTKIGSEFLQRGYQKSAMMVAFNKVMVPNRMTTLEKMERSTSGRLTLVIPFDKRLPNISSILHQRWQCLLSRDSKAKGYMPEPPRVGYTRTKSLRDILVRSNLPPPTPRQLKRQANPGFQKFG